MVAKKLKDFLDSKKVKYNVLSHNLSYTTQELSDTAHISSEKIAKSVIVKSDEDLIMAVLPGNKKLNLDALKKVTKLENLKMADESDFKRKFSDCEVGALPPFGNLYGIKIYVDDNLSLDKEIAFNAGSHTEVIKISYKDFENLAQPQHAKIAQ